MAPDSVQAVGSWLRSRWQVSVPEGWLQACVEFLQQEAGGRPLGLTQLQQQALEQWLQTDLRSLAMSSLPASLGQELKTELQGNVCVQLDSLQDVSQPAYSQLQRLKGSDCSNDQIGAVTQATQRPWEAAPTRMLMLQLTDGVQSVEAMEYKPVPQLNTSLPAGTKLLLRGPITCRLGVLLLGPQNVQVLGGEVEELLHTNSQAHVLSRALGLPEPEPAGEEEEEEEEEEGEAGAIPAPDPHRRPGGAAGPAMRPPDDLDDMEMMAGLEGVEEQASLDSGYRSASVLSMASSSGPPTQPQPQPFPVEEDDPGWWSPGPPHGSMEQEEDFQDDDDIPLDELDNVLSQHLSQDAGLGPQGNFLSPPEPVAPAVSAAQALRPPAQMAEQGHARQARSNILSPTERVATTHLQVPASRPPVSTTPRAEQEHARQGNGNILSPPERSATIPMQIPALRPAANTGTSPVTAQARQGGEILSHLKPTLTVCPAPRPPEQDPHRPQPAAATFEAPPRRAAAGVVSSSSRALGAEVGGVSWDSPPFAYLWNLPTDAAREVRVHAFVVTLKSNIRSAGGHWSLDVSLSDGSAYADVELADGVLEGLIGLSVAEERALKRTAEGQSHVTAGIQRCQRALVDLCGIMTLQVGPQQKKPLVVAVAPVSPSDCTALQQRVEERRAWR